ncbi:hypothetical protein EQ875_03861 [Photobacterium damselae subsp. damselae]|uniref:hypothetical protein n=1 Tax=Photobacterium damselae TaxID=38293 RepID=UPI00109BE1C5|nr:hypothetical protein [Photobacterium damselae]TGZ32580.1 hypothetical protein EQ875_03861 [Photobacterium damselae subsp. damselae]
MVQGLRNATAQQPNIRQAIAEVDTVKKGVTAQEIEAAWSEFIKTGEINPIFDDPVIINTAYDIKRYTPELMQAFSQVAKLMPQVISGQQKPDVLIDALNLIYRKNIDKVVGQKDESGKTITKAQLVHIDLLADIDPNMAGDQPGIVLAIEVFYEDGSSGGVRPITKNRSTAKDDNPMVIPLQSAMGDLSGQLALAQKLMHSDHYQSLFPQQAQPQQTQSTQQPQPVADSGAQ